MSNENVQPKQQNKLQKKPQTKPQDERQEEESEGGKSRKYLLTINNPKNCGLTLDKVDKLVQGKIKPEYYCRSEEIGGESGTPHYHIYLYHHNTLRFNVVKKCFPSAHMDESKGTSKQNRDYVAKEGKWADTEKATTKVEGTFAEFGELPIEAGDRPKKPPMMAEVIDMIEAGATDAEIIKAIPNAASQVKNFPAIRAAINASKQQKFREIEVVYLYGATGTGKTRSIFASHEQRDICRITHYSQSGAIFDAYDSQDVLVFEEFASQIPLSEMLNYLDVYPIKLPARYADKTALYTKVYITSNLSLDEQYPDEPTKRREALYRRITRIVEFKAGGSTVVHKGEV